MADEVTELIERVQVLDVPSGSIVVLRDFHLDGPTEVALVVRELRRAVGHDDFTVLTLEGSAHVEIVTDPDDLLDALAAKLAPLLATLPPPQNGSKPATTRRPRTRAGAA